MARPEAALAHYESQLRQAEATVLLAQRQWRRMSLDDLDRSWAQIVQRLTVMVASGMLGAAKAGAAYVPEALDDGSAAGLVAAGPFARAASDGRALDSLLYSAVVRVKTNLSGGTSPQAALAAGGAWLDTLAGTQVADAGRGAAGVAITLTPRAGFERLVTPPCCQRCAVLAGKFFRWNAGFQRHPKCFPAGVRVSGPVTNAATRRWYEGELVVLTTASGQDLPLTGNHPVLTSRGWVPAHLLQEGDEVLRSTRAQGATPLVVPDHHQVPALIEDVWYALGMGGFDRMPASPKDFHGDGQNGDVDVVCADGSLWDRTLAPFDEHGTEFPLASGIMHPTSLDGERVSELRELRDLAHAGSAIGSRGLSLSFFGGGPLVPNLACLASPSALNSGLAQDLRDCVPRDAIPERELQRRGSSPVGLNDIGARGLDCVRPRWDAPDFPLPEQTRAGYASVGADLLQRLSGQVEPDRLIKVRRVGWSGHVFSLSTDEGWHSANSLIVSNCDCRHVPVLEGQQRRASAISPTDVKDLTLAQRAAIADGADLNQVVNAKRGRSGMTTTEGTTRRGYASYVRREVARQRGLVERETVSRGTGRRNVTRVGGRLTPEAIHRLASTREEAVRLLALNGYIVGDVAAVAARVA